MCADRIFMGTNDARLIAIDAATGGRCTGFGSDGEVRIDPGMPLLWPGEFQIMLRAFDVATGELLWRWQLPAAGQATPMTYVRGGRQYVVIHAGGNPAAQGRLGDAVVAFGLE